MSTAAIPSFALVKRELIRSLRKVGSFIILLAFLILTFLIFASIYPAYPLQPMEMSRISGRLIGGITILLFILITLLIPGLAATSIVGEKEADTFDMLNLTLIKPGGIIFGKMISVVGFFILLTISIFPVMSVVFFLTGVDWVELSISLCWLIAYAFVCAMIGIFCSTLGKKSSHAIFRSYEALFVHALLLPLLIYVAVGAASINHNPSPFLVFTTALVLFIPDEMSAGMRIGGIFYQIVWGLLFYWVSTLILRRPSAGQKVSSEKPIDEPKKLAERKYKFPYYLVDPLKRKKPISDDINPMFAKEYWWGISNRQTVMIRAFYISLIFYTIGAFASPLVYIISSAIFAPAMLAGALTIEREAGNLDMLRMTLLKPKEIVMGKLYSGAISLLPFVVSAMIASIIAAAAKPNSAVDHFTGFITLLACMTLSINLSLLASLLSLRTSSAVVLSYLFNFAAFAGIASFSQISFDLNTETMAFLSPIIAYVEYALVKRQLSMWLSNIIFFMFVSYILMKLNIFTFIRKHAQDK